MQCCSDGSTEPAVKMALKFGYRYIGTAEAYGNEAQQAGKIRSIGISEFTPKFWYKWKSVFDDVTPAIN